MGKLRLGLSVLGWAAGLLAQPIQPEILQAKPGHSPGRELAG
jgi:hypothetical protein